jgi:hypothetical protein
MNELHGSNVVVIRMLMKADSYYELDTSSSKPFIRICAQRILFSAVFPGIPGSGPVEGSYEHGKEPSDSLMLSSDSREKILLELRN